LNDPTGVGHAPRTAGHHREREDLMRTLVTTFGALALALAGAASTLAQTPPVIDGTADNSYGAPLSTQNTNTQFGNATSGDPINGGGGSEINRIFARVSNGRLYVLMAGNLETNFNKLEVFIDSEAGGSNTITGSALPGGVDGFCCGGFPPPDGNNTDNFGALQRMQGLTFDADFAADHYLTFTHGFENALDPGLGFYAASAHYADLTDGTSGRAGALGMQLAQRGLPQVLRGTTADVDVDGDADGNDFLIIQRNMGSTGLNQGTSRLSGDATGDGNVDAADLALWQAAYGFSNATATFGANYFAPQNSNVDDSNVLLGPALPGLTQGDLIDKTYAFGPGGATDNAGTGAVTRELEFVLPPIAGTTNAASHRNMDNIVDLQMAIDNSNVGGVSGAGPYTDPTTEDLSQVITGIEFSIPLSEIGNPTGDVKLFFFVNGGGHDYASNQFSGQGILDGNLGGNGFGGFTGDLSGVNMNDFEGNQYVTVTQGGGLAAVPEPAGAVLVFAAVVGLAAARRRR
jgi:hypothetical protein